MSFALCRKVSQMRAVLNNAALLTNIWQCPKPWRKLDGSFRKIASHWNSSRSDFYGRKGAAFSLTTVMRIQMDAHALSWTQIWHSLPHACARSRERLIKLAKTSHKNSAGSLCCVKWTPHWWTMHLSFLLLLKGLYYNCLSYINDFHRELTEQGEKILTGRHCRVSELCTRRVSFCFFHIKWGSSLVRPRSFVVQRWRLNVN